MIPKFKNFLNENLSDRLTNFVEDSIQEIIDDLHLVNQDDVDVSWTDFWNNENGWYKIENSKDKNDDFFLKNYLSIDVKFCIIPKLSYDFFQKINSVRYRFDKSGLISRLHNKNNNGNGSMSATYKLEIVGKQMDFKNF